MSLAKYFKIIDRAELSDISKTNYKDRLKKLTDITGKDVTWILTHTEELWEHIKTTTTSAETMKAYVTCVLAVFKHEPTLKILYKFSHEQWVDLYKQIMEIIEERFNKLEPSERQVDAYMEWKDIIKGRDNVKDKSSQQYLLICLMTMIPPCRADLNKVRIYRDHTPSDEEKLKDPNYILIKTSSTTRPKMTLMYHEFKTMCVERPFYKKELPTELVDVIIAHLGQNTTKRKQYLITSPRSGLPYNNVKSYQSYFNAQTAKVYGRNVSINVFRHSYIIYYCKIHPSFAKRQELAIDMMNSVKTLERYQYEPEYLSKKKK